ncbi:MAG: polysaccharide deacetylase family protein [Paludibacteraceae bacterium]|nr:polysaccharide deacetylase family protein [Paludibacteraceae bacterium]
MFIEQMPDIIRKLYPSVLWRMGKNEKVIYLTFDDGPTAEVTHWILDKLNEFGIKATFFCIGNNAEKHPEILDEIRKNGHQVGIHGYSHVRGLYKKKDLYLDDIKKSQNIIKSNIFRPSHGRIYPSQARELKKLGYKVVLWDVITRDYDQDLTEEEVLEIAKKYSRNGSIVVFHDSLKAEKNMKYAFPMAVKYWLENGYIFKTL